MKREIGCWTILSILGLVVISSAISSSSWGFGLDAVYPIQRVMNQNLDVTLNGCPARR